MDFKIKYEELFTEFSKMKEFRNCKPVVINESANLIVHLVPYNVIARISLISKDKEDKYICLSLSNELNVARHLKSEKINAIQPSSLIKDNPKKIDKYWITFWEYKIQTDLFSLSAKEAYDIVDEMTLAMSNYKGKLSRLYVWKRIDESVKKLKTFEDENIQFVIKKYEEINKMFISLDSNLLVPSYGDAHAGNLLLCDDGSYWADFEDVCLMPYLWDYASFISNIALLKGFDNPIVNYFLDQEKIIEKKEYFKTLLIARALMSVIGNVTTAMSGYGDKDYANMQLSKIKDYISELEL